MIAAFAPMLLAVSISSKPCDAILVPRGGITIDDGPGQCEEYAREHMDARTDVVVYAFEKIDHPPYEDFAHRVFIALLTRGHKGSWRIVDRQDLTRSLINNGELDESAGMDATISRFQLDKVEFIDVAVAARISGNGQIWNRSDWLFPADTHRLRPATILEGTEGWARGGWSFVQETTSEVLAGRDELIWICRASIAKGNNPEQPLISHCNVSRRVYQLRGGQLFFKGTITARALEKRRQYLRPLPRFRIERQTPCCAGCAFKEEH